MEDVFVCRSHRTRIVVAVIAVLVLTFSFAFVSTASAQAVDTKAMYRMYNPNSGEHFYTASEYERDHLMSVGWNYEGVGWTAPAKSDTPVYRLYSGTDHHYTKSAYERDELVRVGWRDEGIGWYSENVRGIPLYRQFNPNVNPSARFNNSGSHNYTTSLVERTSLVEGNGWNDEDVAWYGVDPSAPSYTAEQIVEIDASIACNPSVVGATSERNNSQWATLTGVVRCVYVESPIAGRSVCVYYLQLPSWVSVEGSQYGDLGGYAIILGAEDEGGVKPYVEESKDKWVSVRCRISGRPTASVAAYDISMLRPSDYSGSTPIVKRWD